VPHRHFVYCGYTPRFATIAESTMTTAPKKESAFMKALKPSAALAAVVGADPLPRTEVIKKLWEYIKAHNLQNPANKRNILCDAKLKAVMGKDEVTMFELTGLAGKHLS
jgi:chromatin remodeling complex protein RSC6